MISGGVKFINPFSTNVPLLYPLMVNLLTMVDKKEVSKDHVPKILRAISNTQCQKVRLELSTDLSIPQAFAFGLLVPQCILREGLKPQ